MLCPPDAGTNVNVLRGIVTATQAPNTNLIPDGVLYRCELDIVDNAVFQRRSGQVVQATGSDGRIGGAASSPPP